MKILTPPEVSPRITTTVAPLFLSILLIMGTVMAPCRASLLYNYSFDGNTGANSGSGTGGTLVATNGSIGSVSFSNGMLNASSNVFSSTPGASGYAGSTGVQLSSLGTTSAITLTFWMKGDQVSNFPRLFTLGSTSTYDGSSTPGGIQVALSGNSNFLISVDGSNATSLSLGPTLSTNEWYFVAVSYDGTSTFGNNSTVQNAATGGNSSRNGQLYVGGIDASVQNYGFSATSSVSPFASVGSINFGDDAYLYLAGRYDGTRGFDGFMDNVRIYDEVLSQTQLNELRLSTIPVPEPSAIMLLLGGCGAWMALRRRKNAA